MSQVPSSQGAPVSGPGAFSQRTDLSPSSGQPVRVPSGQPHGERQRMEQQQGAAPMQAAGPPPGLIEGAFGPTGQPQVGPTDSPAVEQPPQDPDALLRALYRKYPHPDIERLLMQRARMV